MSSTEEWCAEKLSKLLNEELRISTLSEIKDHLQSIPPNEIKPTVNSLDIPLVFDCLNNTNIEQIDLACEVLSMCLNNLNIGESATKFGISLERALTHPYPAVKLMVLEELERNVKNDDILVDLCKRTSLLACLVRCLSSEELSVGSKTSNVLKIIGCSDIGIKQLTSVDLIKIFDEIMSTNEINRMRIFELFVNISLESKSSFQILNAAGLISPIIIDLDNNDILLKMNIIVLLSQLGLCEHGLEYLQSKNVLTKLSKMLKNDDPINSQILEPGILNFFGSIGHWKPKEITEKYPSILLKMFDNLSCPDFSLVGISLDVIGNIALTSDGKCSLDSLHIVEKGISTISKKFGSFPTEITIRALKCIENMLRSDDNNNSQTHLISRKWFYALGKNPMVDIVMKYSKNPFTEIRVAGLNVISSISNQLWGQEIIKDTPGLIEFIMDRNAETHKEAKEIKYEIVKALRSSSIFDQKIVEKFDNYVKEGPFYVQGIIEVAFERND